MIRTMPGGYGTGMVFIGMAISEGMDVALHAAPGWGAVVIYAVIGLALALVAVARGKVPS